jgi:hypothetical protein
MPPPCIHGQANVTLGAGDEYAYSEDGAFNCKIANIVDNMNGVIACRDMDFSKLFAKSNKLTGVTLIIRVYTSTDNGATWTEQGSVKIPDGDREGANGVTFTVAALTLYCFSVEASGGAYTGPVSYLGI